MQPFHVYVVSDEADADFVEPFVRVLREHGWRVFDAVADPQPGDDAAEQRMTAASRSMWFAVVRGAGRPAELRAAVLALLERRKEDRTARVIPVHLVAPDGHDQSFADLPLLKPIDATSAEATAAAESVHRVALREGLRDWWDTRAEVALLRVAAEAGEPAGALAEVLRAQSGQVRAVHELELGDAVAGAQAEHALVRLVVLGGSTGGEAGVAQVRAWV
ncbi:MAG: toll/interleukin-1 receptor domain-containing protein, partial [Myxococcales bacterium]|nr:toll/interleukin-1 receptor domain-containing protein [Myxococcales bacterium]